MIRPVRIAREARDELREAARWYAAQRAGLAAEFLAAIDDAIERLVKLAPHLGTAPGIDSALGIKRVFVKRFPFSLYFIELPTRYRVLAVAHSRRRPFYWHDRR
jgi:toxin ParE1/3/4